MMKFQIKNIVKGFLFGAIVLTALSCENPVAEQPLRSPDGRTPLVTGLRVTTVEHGHEQVDVWGFPSDPPELPTPPLPPHPVSQNGQTKIEGVENPIPIGFHSSIPYPNPMKHRLIIGFQIPYAMKVSVWIVPAKLATEYANNISLVSINYKTETDGVAIVELLRDAIKSAGSYAIFWDRNDRNGNKVKQGIYRVYTQANEYLLWRDILIWDDETQSPRQLFGSINN